MTTRKHSERYYVSAREKIYAKLAGLPRGTIKERVISGKKYYYLQNREGKKVIHKYIGKQVPPAFLKKVRKREELRRELYKLHDVLMGFWAPKIRGL